MCTHRMCAPQERKCLRVHFSALIFTLLSFCERQAACLCIVDPFTVGALALRFCRCRAFVPAAPVQRCFLG